jgi:hypothetical protein
MLDFLGGQGLKRLKVGLGTMRIKAQILLILGEILLGVGSKKCQRGLANHNVNVWGLNACWIHVDVKEIWDLFFPFSLERALSLDGRS